ncbi:uncharacterized protein LOC131613848 [Vicia villosa]|uniref:uncharacterized protein LOC131613848 n=1 Tax=Vicia villosa TaxID=3911 RepID=UPI00273C4C46|nr:uncharacterized protein LOC131613848 [Vicia villosa]
MIVGSLNIRGGGSSFKRNCISKIIKSGNADIFLLQETKLEVIDSVIAGSLWQNENVGWSFSKSEGRSGGLVILWRENIFDLVFSFKGTGYIGIKIWLKDSYYYICNIYSPCSFQGKKELWRDFLLLKTKYADSEWLMGGDFNATKDSRERKGNCIGRSMESNCFSSFIDKSRLIDVPSSGNKFSWYSGDGRFMSKIDRFLVEDSLICRWGIVGQRIGSRSISDHCPVWIIINKENWGPKPFLVNNSWFEDKDFLPFVEKEWEKLVVSGRGDYILKEKLRLLKDSLRRWNLEVFG